MNSLLQKLYNLNRFAKAKYNLDTIRKLNTLFRNPSNAYHCIHVAGTNGKGSVATKISNGLINSGLKVGLFTSPHISCFRERVRLNGIMVSEHDTERLLSQLFTTVEAHNLPTTFFEMTTMLALLYFAEQQVDWAVIEVGLGGRLDATNIITPALSIITSISLDHTEILGSTLEEITHEKAGILKPSIPIIIGPTVPENIITTHASSLKCPIHSLKGSFSSYDEENNSIARKAMELLNIPQPHINSALQTKPPCRLEVFSQPQTVIFDVAHNPIALIRLFEDLKNKFPQRKFFCVCGFSKTKDITSCLNILKDNIEAVHFVEASNGETVSITTLKQLMCQFHPIYDSLDALLQDAKKINAIVIVCGSFYIMSILRRYFGIEEKCDPIDLNEKRDSCLKILHSP